MNTLNATLFVFYENSPSEQEKYFIKEKIETFLLKIDPQALPEITCGDGSWWIAALWWAGEQFLEWLAGKGFDAILDQSKKQLPHSENSNRTNPESESFKPDSSNKLPTKPTSDYSLDYSSLYQSMNDLMKSIDSGSGCKTEIVLGVYNNSNNVGRVVSLRKVGEDVTFSIMQTDSKDDYNSLTNP